VSCCKSTSSAVLLVSLICGIDSNVALPALLIDIVVAGLGGVRSEVGRFSINRYPSDAHKVRGLIMIEAGKSLPTINGRRMCD
jgi:hypothetical protein